MWREVCRCLLTYTYPQNHTKHPMNHTQLLLFELSGPEVVFFFSACDSFYCHFCIFLSTV